MFQIVQKLIVFRGQCGRDRRIRRLGPGGALPLPLLTGSRRLRQREEAGARKRESERKARYLPEKFAT
jgi:hypothetical protein